MHYLYSSDLLKWVGVLVFVCSLSYILFKYQKLKNEDKDLNRLDLVLNYIIEDIIVRHCLFMVHIWVCRDFNDFFFVDFTGLSSSFNIAQLWLYFVDGILYIIRQRWYDKKGKP